MNIHKQPTVEYCIDPFHDALTIWGMLTSPDPAGKEHRIKSMGLTNEVAEVFEKAKDFKDIEEYASKYVGERHSEHIQELEEAKNLYQIEWDKINYHFFSTIEKITGHTWKHELYYVVVSPIHKGVSTLGGDTVVRSAFEDPRDQLRITAHELLMSHIWTVLWEVFPESKEGGNSFWAANELVTNAILGLDPEFMSVWAEKSKGYDQYLSNYPQLSNTKDKLKELYLQIDSFEGLLKKVLEMVEKK